MTLQNDIEYILKKYFWETAVYRELDWLALVQVFYISVGLLSIWTLLEKIYR